MRDEEWIKTLEDGRRVKLLAGDEIVYSVVLTKARSPLSSLLKKSSEPLIPSAATNLSLTKAKERRDSSSPRSSE